MKKVHSSKQLMHLFCNMINADLDGFRTSSRNLYVERGVLYSYGSHYPMAAKYMVGHGIACHEVVLINSVKSSVTTQKHKSILSRSLKPSQISFDVPNVQEPKDPLNLLQLDNDLIGAIESILSCLKYTSFYDVRRLIDERNMYAKTFGFKDLSIDPNFLSDLESLSNQTELKRKARTELKEKERRIELLEYEDEVKLWFECKNTRNIPEDAFSLNGYEYDVIRVKDLVVETQRGASVPLSKAMWAYNRLMRGLLKVGESAGPFTVDAIDTDFVTIGCHKFSINQVSSQLQRLL